MMLACPTMKSEMKEALGGCQQNNYKKSINHNWMVKINIISASAIERGIAATYMQVR
jgi:hypothetical protein